MKILIGKLQRFFSKLLELERRTSLQETQHLTRK